VAVVVAHESLAAAQNVFLRVVEGGGDAALELESETVEGAAVEVMHLGADAQQKVVGLLEGVPLGGAQEFFFDQLRGGVDALRDVGDPEQILVVAQAADAVFHVWLLHEKGAAELLVRLSLAGDAPLDVGVLAARDAIALEAPLELVEELAVAEQEAALEHRGLGDHVVVRRFHGLRDGARGMPDLEAEIPQAGKSLADDVLELRAGFSAIDEEHDVHVAEGIHLAPAVAAEGRGDDAAHAGFSGDARGNALEEFAKDDVDEVGALAGDLPAAAAGVVPEPQAVFLELEEALEDGQPVLAAFARALGELAGGFGEHAFLVKWDHGCARLVDPHQCASLRSCSTISTRRLGASFSASKGSVAGTINCVLP